MSGLPWFKCYPRDFNDGMMGLTLEERGAYITILNCIYMRGGPVSDDPLYWRAMLQCGGKTWSKIRAALIFKKRLFEVSLNGEPCLMNQRAAEEIAQTEAQRKILSERGAKGGRISQSKSKENNDLTQAPARQGLKPGSSDIDTDTEVDILGAKAPCPKRISDPADAVFDEAWRRYPAKGRERSKSRAKTYPIWREAAKAAGGADRLRDAVDRYVQFDQQHKGECGPPAFDRWLRDGRWEHWLPEGQSSVVIPMKIDPELAARRAALLAGE